MPLQTSSREWAETSVLCSFSLDMKIPFNTKTRHWRPHAIPAGRTTCSEWGFARWVLEVSVPCDLYSWRRHLLSHSLVSQRKYADAPWSGPPQRPGHPCRYQVRDRCLKTEGAVFPPVWTAWQLCSKSTYFFLSSDLQKIAKFVLNQKELGSSCSFGILHMSHAFLEILLGHIWKEHRMPVVKIAQRTEAEKEKIRCEWRWKV